MENEENKFNPAAKILIFGALLAAGLLAVRVWLLAELGFELPLRLRSLPTLFSVAYYDLLFAAALTAGFIVIFLIFQRRKSVRAWMPRVFWGLAFASLGYAVMNVSAVEQLGSPLTYSLLYYSDFLGCLEVRRAMESPEQLRFYALLAGILASFCVLSLLAGRGAAKLSLALRRRPWIFGVGCVAVLGYLILGGIHEKTVKWDRARTENAIFAMAGSLWSGDRGVFPHEGGGPPTPAYQIFGRQLPSDAPAIVAGRKPGMNVLFFVMESVGARYLDIFGGPYDVTPHLKSWLGEGMAFNDIYATMPMTDRSLVSLLCGIYPYPSYKSITKESPRFGVPSISEVLKRHGYRTGFFSGANLDYLDMNGFLKQSGVDHQVDYYTLSDRKVEHDDSKSLDAQISDETLADSFLDWALATNGQPFFAVLWTDQTHAPYLTFGPQKDFGVKDADLNRYLNAIMASDEALNHILESLREHGQADNTIIVVVGDHGEAFGEHGQTLHARGIYEENLHVPCVILDPRVFHGERSDKLGALFDLPPTVLDLLGGDSPAGWQGASLLGPFQRSTLFFHTPFGTDLLFGCRTGGEKFIYDVPRDQFQVFDLKADPLELHDLAAQHQSELGPVKQKIANWYHFQKQYCESQFHKTPGE